jgi:predicted KAP-like P-loop ATPase
MTSWFSYFFCCATRNQTVSQTKKSKETKEKTKEEEMKKHSSFSFFSQEEEKEKEEKEEEKRVLTRKESSFHFLQYINPLYYARKNVVAFLEWEEDKWKERLCYPHSMYAFVTVVTGFTIYGLVLSFPYSLWILGTGAAVGIASYYSVSHHHYTDQKEK